MCPVDLVAGMIKQLMEQDSSPANLQTCCRPSVPELMSGTDIDSG